MCPIERDGADKPMRIERAGATPRQMGLDQGGELGDFLGPVASQIGAFGWIRSEVEQPRFALLRVRVELPVAAAHDVVGARLPEQRVVLTLDNAGAGGRAKQASPIDDAVVGQRRSRRFGSGCRRR